MGRYSDANSSFKIAAFRNPFHVIFNGYFCVFKDWLCLYESLISLPDRNDYFSFEVKLASKVK